ncbi:MAG: hypothetical protein ACQESB_01015 [Elusimicrobiota bacterium]
MRKKLSLIIPAGNEEKQFSLLLMGAVQVLSMDLITGMTGKQNRS